MQSDAAYFRRRAQEEIDAAMAAKSISARKAHLELAQRYGEFAEAIERQERESSFTQGHAEDAFTA